MLRRLNPLFRHASLITTVGILELALGLSSCQRSVEKPAEIVAAEANLPEKVDYNLHVKPILSDRCFACHGPDQNKQKAGLRLDTPEGAYEALAESGNTAIDPGNLAHSEVYHRIVSTDPDYMMPTPESNLALSVEEKATLIRWIEQGAEYKEHWSLTAPTLPDVPKAGEAWARNEIDRFVAQTHSQQKLKPAPEADRLTLLRRVSLDLTGLPPTPAEVDQFMADKSPQAYEKAVDRLLKSPHYGERQAVDWLDLARYADTHGYQDDGLRTMWPYRDWVIRSFNQNQPYDTFITWQLAGDLLPNTGNRATDRDRLIATAFNRNHQQSQEGGIVPEEYRQEYLADRAATFGKAMLGMSVECARCHDHKYDPISQKDYYALTAFFAQNNEYGQIPYNGEPSPHITLPTPEADAKLTAIRKRINTLDRARKADEEGVKQRFADWLAKAEKAPQTALLPAQKNLVIYVPFDQSKDVPVESKKKDEKKPDEAKQKPTKASSLVRLASVRPEPPKPAEPKPEPPKIRRLFANIANDTLPLETQGDLDYPIPFVKGAVGRGVRLVGESLLQLKGAGRWEKPENDWARPAWFERHQPFTVSLWVNVNDPKLEGSLFNRDLGPFNGFRGYRLQRLPDGRLAFRMSYVWPDDAIDIETRQRLPLNHWMHLTISYDGSSRADGVQFFVNGNPTPTRVMTDNLTQSTVWGKNHSYWGAGTPNFSIGHSHDQNYKGYAVDEVRVYNRALTRLEAQSLTVQRDVVREALLNPDRTEAQQADLFAYYLTNFDRPYGQRQAARQAQLAEETRILNEQIDVMTMSERRYKVATHLLKRGAYDAPGEQVTAEVPHFLPPLTNETPNRLGLAQWLLRPDNPLFARVAVNRIWQQYFGQGLVKSSDDFGNQGNLPSHPALLDYLAVRFREGGPAPDDPSQTVGPWDVKALHKLIVLSATYRQSSSVPPSVRERDLDNTYLSRGPSYRLSAEQVRDNALAASGLLTRQIGGPSVHPYQPAGIWEALATRNAVNYVQNHGDSLYRRSMYTIWKRSSPPPMMLNFDAAERHTCTVKRQKTSTPLQALVTLNDPQFVEAARVLAQKEGEKRKGNLTNGAEIIHAFFKSIVGRPARPQELRLMQQLYTEELRDFRANPKRAAELLTVGEYPVTRQLPPDQLAAWTVVGNTIMNFDEAIVKR
ncbi:DUF1553 domain-containing protein [Rudanella paleaurantiibacter]|uniref:DUF1553 domain-containing protein n=2 Tax=Rudanella paleaurantiibacter TaxID=2614655 RepID=A0A7J5TWV5_9BACT|nr:DUF1553 domain-containing protein [Rudanella paleaurantiibacter]